VKDHCPECNAPVAPDEPACPHCGTALRAAMNAFETLDAAMYPPDTAAADVDATLDVADPDSTSDAGAISVSSTVDAAPGLHDSGSASTGGTSADAARVGEADLNAGNTDATMDAPIGGNTSGSGVAFSIDQTVDVAAPGDGSDRAGEGVPPVLGDEAGTLVLPGANATLPASDLEGTAIFSVESAPAPASDSNQQSPKSGSGAGGSSAFGSKGRSLTSGRLQRMWEGAAGVSQNPLHSLQGSAALASESVFNRIARRMVTPPDESAEAASDYQIIKKLGEGAMGIVYEARQRAIDRIVALKAIKSGTQLNDESRRRFFYEAQITADLDHANIVPIYELGETQDGMPFYSMKKVKGKEWKELIKTQTRDQNLEVFMKVADAMAFAHSKQIIHRDLKPENTMLGQFGEVYVTDWGLAVNLNHGKPSSLAGTPVYMAPEMASHSIKKIGTCSDIYVLGAILYQIVTGRTPRTAKTVSQCLRAAVNNEIAPYEKEDPLLDIALRAMATAPEDRYQTVEEMQEAIRAFRRHAESITLAQRAEELLATAVVSKDYETFTRAVFSFRDAVELWPENHSAGEGLKRARLALGRCAVAKGDYDLALQSLDTTVPEEAQLHAEAARLKRIAEGRERRFKTMRRALVAVILLGILVSSSLAGVAFIQRDRALLAEDEANQNAEQANLARQAADKAANEAILAQNEAIISRNEAIAAREEEEQQRRLAVMARDEAIQAREQEEEQRRQADRAKDAAILAQQNEAEQRRVAHTQRRIAEQRAAQVQLGEYRANLALAKAQLEQFDVSGSVQILAALKQLNHTDAFHKQIGEAEINLPPKFDNWPWQRVNLLSNSDLPRQDLNGPAQRLAYAPEANIGVASMRDGRLQVLRFAGNQLQVVQSHHLPGARILGAAISPLGDEVTFSTQHDGAHQVYVWPLDQAGAEPIPVTATAKRSMQNFAYSPDGSLVLGGINQGIWIWERKPQWYLAPEPDRKIEDLRASLENLQILDSRHALASCRLNDRFVLFKIDLQAGKSRLIQIPPTADIVCAAHAYGSNRLWLGSSSGNLLLGELYEDHETAAADRLAAPLSLRDLSEILPKKHRSRIQQIAIHPSNSVLTMSEEPVAHLWQPDGANWQYDTHLSGTPQNLAAAMFMGSPRQVIGLDDGGTAIAWDIARQKQRLQLTRTSQGVAAPYAAPVMRVFNQQTSPLALAIDANGVLDLWNLVDGATQPLVDPRDRTLDSAMRASPTRPDHAGMHAPVADATASAGMPHGSRWSYFGHTPGAEFVDSAIDLEAGVLVTSARTTRANRKYLPAHAGQWEFCVWDLRTQAMLARWQTTRDDDQPRLLPTADSNTANLNTANLNTANLNTANLNTADQTPANSAADSQTATRGTADLGTADLGTADLGTAELGTADRRLSLIDHGRRLLVASDHETLIYDLQGQVEFRDRQFATHFGIPNPVHPSLIALVNHKGIVRILDLEALDAPVRDGWRNDVLTLSPETPLAGIWSSAGDRFYLAFTSGGLAAFNWDAQTLQLTWSDRSLDGSASQRALQETLRNPQARVQSHCDLDLAATRRVDGGDTVILVKRTRGARPATHQLTLEFPADGGAPAEQDNLPSTPGLRWLEQAAEGLRLTDEIHDLLALDPRRLRLRTRLEGTTFVSTSSAIVWELKPGSANFNSYGRHKLRDATADAAGRQLISLHEDGSLWRLELSDNQLAQWTPCGYSSHAAVQLQLSPDGAQLALLCPAERAGHYDLVLVDARSGEQLEFIKDVVATLWQPGAPATLLLADAEGQLLRLDQGQQHRLATVRLPEGSTLVGLHLFTEAWSTVDLPAAQHLLIHTESLGKDSGHVHFVPLDAAPAAEPIDLTPLGEDTIPRGTKLVTSPTEGIFVTGTPSGTVSVWFASPNWEPLKSLKLFDLEGHLGSPLSCVAFSADGQTIITADQQGRLFGWLSRDPLSAAPAAE
jgi:WD40 repeat protein/tRNA A-37 threonylcarbamoyl transferase component Bud32